MMNCARALASAVARVILIAVFIVLSLLTSHVSVYFAIARLLVAVIECEYLVAIHTES